MHDQYIWRFLRAQKIDLSGRKSWCENNDPDFVAKSAKIVGLYIALRDLAFGLGRWTKVRQGQLRSPIDRVEPNG